MREMSKNVCKSNIKHNKTCDSIKMSCKSSISLDDKILKNDKKSGVSKSISNNNIVIEGESKVDIKSKGDKKS